MEVVFMNKVSVAVSCRIDTDGNVQPLCIKWKDGRQWEIERVLHTCRSPDQSFEGVRYTILIGGVEKYLYMAKTRYLLYVHLKYKHSYRQYDHGLQ